MSTLDIVRANEAAESLSEFSFIADQIVSKLDEANTLANGTEPDEIAFRAELMDGAKALLEKFDNHFDEAFSALLFLRFQITQKVMA